MRKFFFKYYKTQWQIASPTLCFLTARGQLMNNKSSAQNSWYGNNMNILRTVICGLEVPKSCHYLVTHSQSKWLRRKFSQMLRLNITMTVRITNRDRYSRHHVWPLIFIVFINPSVPISVCGHTVIPPTCAELDCGLAGQRNSHV
jgi:uncharacterized membrane protein SirB2